MIKKPIVLVPLFALFAYAADFWVAKPFTSWNDKEVAKMVTDSHWAQKVESTIIVTETTGGGGGGGGSKKGGGGGGGGAPGGSSTVVLLWQSALPVKQALMKTKFGPEAGTSPDSKAVLEREEKFYVMRVAGLPGYTMMSASGDGKKTLLAASSLTVEGKEPLLAVEVQTSQQQPKAGAPAAKGGFGGAPVDFFFLFPRTTVFSPDDHEVEFKTRVGMLSIHHKFNLKDMVYNGKLEM